MSLFPGAIALALIPVQVAELLGIVVPHMKEQGFTPATAVGLSAVGFFTLLGWGLARMMKMLPQIYGWRGVSRAGR